MQFWNDCLFTIEVLNQIKKETVPGMLNCWPKDTTYIQHNHMEVPSSWRLSISRVWHHNEPTKL